MLTIKLAKTNHNDKALTEARNLNYQTKQPIFCAVDSNGSIFDLAIGEKVFPQNFVFDEVGQTQAKKDVENQTKTKYNFNLVGKVFTFLFEGQTYQGAYTCSEGALITFYRLPEFGLKVRSFKQLIQKLKGI